MKIAIIGGSPSWVDAPFQDEGWEIWVLGNQLDRYKGKRVTRIFEIHDDLSEKHTDYPKWLVSQKIPLVVGDKFPQKADHVETYPEDKVRYPGLLTSSPAYMMGYALLLEPKEIAIYGVDMAVDDHEYFLQQPAMHAWIGYAQGKGVKVTVHKSSPLMRSNYREGKDYNPNRKRWESEFQQIADEHSRKADEIREKVRQLQIQEAAHEGARQAYERLAKTGRAWDSGQDISLTQSMVIK